MNIQIVDKCFNLHVKLLECVQNQGSAKFCDEDINNFADCTIEEVYGKKNLPDKEKKLKKTDFKGYLLDHESQVSYENEIDEKIDKNCYASKYVSLYCKFGMYPDSRVNDCFNFYKKFMDCSLKQQNKKNTKFTTCFSEKPPKNLEELRKNINYCSTQYYRDESNFEPL
jgi:hypothetical protein